VQQLSEMIQERVLGLQKEIEKLRAASEKYHSVQRHSAQEITAQLRREFRLRRLVNDLASLSKMKPY